MVDKRAMQDQAENELWGQDNMVRRQMVKLADLDIASLFERFQEQYERSLAMRLHGEGGESVPERFTDVGTW